MIEYYASPIIFNHMRMHWQNMDRQMGELSRMPAEVIHDCDMTKGQL